MITSQPRACISLHFFFLFRILTLVLAFTPNSFDPNTALRSDTGLLQDVLKAIVESQKWDLGSVRVLDLDWRNSRFGTAQRYEFRVRVGKSHLLFKFSDEVTSWKRFRDPPKDFGSLVNRLSSFAVIDPFKIEGPVQLWVTGNDDQLSLLLSRNAFAGLKRIIVGERITLAVTRAQEVSFLLASDMELLMNGSDDIKIKGRNGQFWPFAHLFCHPLHTVRIRGSASLAAYRPQKYNTFTESILVANDTVELLPEKCHIGHGFRLEFPLGYLNLRTHMLGRILKNLFGGRIHQNGYLGFIKTKIKASTVIRFHLQLERDIGSNEKLHRTMAEWRTRPSVERVWFEVLARVEGNTLRPQFFKKVKRFLEVDTVAWSNLLFNISFTKFASVLVPPEALTLDVKW